ncbi:M13 family metallopeptidase [Nakamurella sp. GG22]
MTAFPTVTDGAATVRPQDDLFRHVNGDWLATAVIPDDRSMDGAFYRLRDGAEADSRAIVEETAAAAGTAESGSPEQLIGDLYRSFMDTATVQRRGLEPLRELLAVVDGITDPRALVEQVGRLRRDGMSGPFILDIDSDPADPDHYVLNLYQGGLGLPDESYYSGDQHAEIRTAYTGFLPEMLDIAGVEDAADAAGRIYRLETDLAAGHWDRVRSRDSSQTYNPKSRAELGELMPAELWDAWVAGLGADPALLDQVVVRQPDYVAALAALLTADRLPDWKDWLRWQIVRSFAPFGPDDLVEKSFAFYGRTLSGVPQLRERWKRGVSFVESAAGEALGRLYVERHFPPAAKQRMDELVANLLEAYRRDITELPWMSPETKARALDKLAAFTPKIGYPDRWRDYSSLVVRADDLAGNARRAAAFELDRQLAKIGTPVDRLEWFMSPQTVNAYYNPGMNEIVFPAAILQPPFFDPEADDAVNYGGIGAVIGHEIGHGFDDQGSKYDGRGALHDWWTASDREAFDALTRKLIDQYNVLEPAQTPGHHVNGALTVGENIGDLGGLAIAFQAWRISLDGRPAEVIDGLTGEQRFFLSWATVWQSKIRDAELLRLLSIDPHSPAEFRCNQVVRNLTEFHEAFGVQQGDGLWLDPDDRVRIW